MKNNSLIIILILIVSYLLTILLFYPVSLYPNSALLVNGGDGIKNYFTYLYSINYDTGYLFRGMNYPYGEHIIFTDNMPLISKMMQWLNSIFPGSKAYSLGVLHYLIFLSIPIASVYTYKILKQYTISNLWAVCASLIITFMSPVIFKAEGHFGMALVGYIPVIIYLVLRYYRTNNHLLMLWLTIITILCGFIHLYNIAFSLIILLFFVLAYLIINKKIFSRKTILFLIPIFGAMIIPTLFITIFMNGTDWIGDRPSYPYGVFGNASQGNDLFLSFASPIWKWVLTLLDSKKLELREGYAYIGLSGLVILIILLLRWIRHLYFKVKKSNKSSFTLPIPEYHIWLLVGVFGFALGMGFPVQSGLHSLPDYISQLRQFRTVGRFSWIFYYVFVIYIFLVMYQYWQANRHIYPKKTMVLTAIFWGLFIVETTGTYFYFRPRLVNAVSDYNSFAGTESIHNFNLFLKEKGYNQQNFQALILLPFFHIGSEKLWISDVDESSSLLMGTKISYQTSIPIVNVMMSRTSWSQTFENVRIANGVLTDKPSLRLFNDKKVLIAINNNAKDKINLNGTDLLHHATSIGHFNNFEILYTDVATIKKHQTEVSKNIESVIDNTNVLEGLIINNQLSDKFYHTQLWEDKPLSNNVKIGKSSLIVDENNTDSFIFNIPVSDTSRDYIISLWANVEQERYQSPTFDLFQYDSKGNELSRHDYNFKYSSLVEDFWMLGEKEIEILPKASKIKIIMSPILDRGYKIYSALDELLLIPKGSYYFRRYNNKIYVNNRLLATSE